MTPHPTLRIRSPKPDILDTADERIQLRLASRLCMRAASFMILLATFFMVSVAITGNMIYIFWLGCALFACFTFMQTAEKLQEERENRAAMVAAT